MSSDHSQRPQRPVQIQPGVLVHPASDRRLAVEHWLLSTLPAEGHARARTEWAEQGVAMLPLGTLFTAIRIPGYLVFAVAGSEQPADIDAFLGAILHGPVICAARQRCYYALTPASTPRTWREDADDVAVLGRDAYLGVPPVDATVPHPQAASAYWSVPMESAGMLCRSGLVGRMIGAGRDLVGGELEANYLEDGR